MTRLAALAAALLLIAACGSSAGPSGTPPGTGAESAAPSPTAAGPAAFVRVDLCAAGCEDPRAIEFLRDGTVIRRAADGSLETRRLSTAGLAAVRARVDRDADLLSGEVRADPTLAPGTTPPPYVWYPTYTIYPDPGGAAYVRVAAIDPASLAGTPWHPTALMERVVSLATDLIAVERLAGDGWLDAAWTAWEPGIRFLFLAARPSVAPFPTPDVGTDTPFDGDLARLAAVVPSPLNAWQETRCTAVAPAAMAALLGTLPPDAIPQADAPRAAYRLMLGDAHRGRVLMLIPVVPLPDEADGGCEGPMLGWVW